MTLVRCKLIDDCLAPKKVGNMVKKKAFRRGQGVVGTVTNIALTPDSQVLALKTKDGYIIPEPFLNVIGAVNDKQPKQQESPYYEEIEDAEIVEEGKSENSVKKVFNSMKTSDIIAKNSIRSKHVVNFALGGAAIGLVWAMIRGSNKLVFATVGAVVGGIAGNYVGKKIKVNEKSK